MSESDIEDSAAPLVEHLIELRQRLVKALIAVFIVFVVAFIFADQIFQVLVIPYERAAGEKSESETDIHCSSGVFLRPAKDRTVHQSVCGLSGDCSSNLQICCSGPLQKRTFCVPAFPDCHADPVPHGSFIGVFRCDAAGHDVFPVNAADRTGL